MKKVCALVPRYFIQVAPRHKEKKTKFAYSRVLLNKGARETLTLMAWHALHCSSIATAGVTNATIAMAAARRVKEAFAIFLNMYKRKLWSNRRETISC